MPLDAAEARVDRGMVRHSFNSPHRIECSNGETYVVKPRRTDRQFANEVLAYVLGKELGVPMPDAALVAIDENFRVASPAAAAKYTAGTHFGSKFLVKSWTFDNPAPGLARSEIRNIDALYGMVTFDEAIGNRDRRNNAGNNLIVQVSDASPRYDYLAIDHGHVLTGPAWTVASLGATPVTPIVPVFRFLETCLISLPQLIAAAQSVADFASQVAGLVNAAQADLNQGERDAVIVFLESRAAQLPAWVQGQEYGAVLQALQP